MHYSKARMWIEVYTIYGSLEHFIHTYYAYSTLHTLVQVQLFTHPTIRAEEFRKSHSKFSLWILLQRVNYSSAAHGIVIFTKMCCMDHDLREKQTVVSNSNHAGDFNTSGNKFGIFDQFKFDIFICLCTNQL